LAPYSFSIAFLIFDPFLVSGMFGGVGYGVLGRSGSRG
jgi:hypothetical protein